MARKLDGIYVDYISNSDFCMAGSEDFEGSSCREDVSRSRPEGLSVVAYALEKGKEAML